MKINREDKQKQTNKVEAESKDMTEKTSINASSKASKNKLKKATKRRRPFKNPCFIERLAGAFCRFIVIGCMLGVACASVLSLCVIGYVVSETKDENIVLSRDDIDMSQTTVFYAKNSQTGDWEVYQTYSSDADRTWVDFEEIPDIYQGFE